MLWGHYYRIIVLLVGFLCFASMCSNYLIINFTFICMQNDFSDGYTDSNGTLHSIYAFSLDQKTWILWAVAAGTIIGTIPFNWLFIKYGARYPFLLSGLVSSVATFFIPWAARIDFFVLILLRFVQGFAYSADFGAIGLMTVRWAPLSETATFVAILTSFNGIASTITNSATGLICESSLGWKYSYYFHAVAGFVLFGIWALVYIDDPQDTPRVSSQELTKIQKNKSEAHLDKTTPVPYKKLLTSPVIWCVWINAFFDLTGAILFSTYVPIYLHQVLEFGIRETGFYSALILGLSLPVRFVFALVSDKLKCINEKAKIFTFNTISVGFSGVIFMCIGFIPVEHRILALLCFILTMCCIGVNPGGFYKVAVLHSRQFAHVVLTAIQWMKCLALFVAPALVSIFVSNEKERHQWIGVYMVLGGCLIVTNIASFFVLTDKAAPWTESETEKL